MFDGLRIGTGFDVHAFAEGRRLWMGGIEIPHSLGLLGHSDADVLIHAIVDSILGALALGDIGQHFSPADSRWKDAKSIDFLKYSAELVHERNAQILSIDSTVICEEPKLSSFVEPMRRTMAEALAIDFGRIHVKATTTERLGFTGRKEGIAAQAVCLLNVLAAK